jgi:glycosyltransferase involved in cell wall biosynthesis
LEERFLQIENGLYPKHHFWGVDHLLDCPVLDCELIKINRQSISPLIEKFVNKLLFKNSTSFDTELKILRAERNFNFIYSVSGPLAFSKFYKRAKVIPWVFRTPDANNRPLIDSYNINCLKNYSGIFCLTPNAEEHYSQYSSSKFIPWCVDLELFDGKPPKTASDKPFFLANGKTYRDYKTLVDGANEVDAELRIIGPNQQKPDPLPPNVKWIDTSSDPPDQALDYPTLREWYAQCIAVCIPLSGDADDTCGYTNMLEAMAMRKPVLMTRSGCLHTNPEADGFGMQINAGDPEGWTQAMNHLHQNDRKVLEMGNRGRRIVEKDFTIERFNQDVLRFVQTILHKS